MFLTLTNFNHQSANSFTANNHVLTSSRPIKNHYLSSRDSCFKKFLRCIQGSERYRRMMLKTKSDTGVNSVSMIDKVSRLLFPLSFMILMGIYAVAYSSWRLLNCDNSCAEDNVQIYSMTGTKWCHSDKSAMAKWSSGLSFLQPNSPFV